MTVTGSGFASTISDGGDAPDLKRALNRLLEAVYEVREEPSGSEMSRMKAEAEARYDRLEATARGTASLTAVIENLPNLLFNTDRFPFSLIHQ